MSLNSMVTDCVNEAEDHVFKCLQFIDVNNDLEGAINYCKSIGIDPPQCSLSAMSKHADYLRAKAKRLMTTQRWWEINLEKKARRQFSSGMLPNKEEMDYFRKRRGPPKANKI